MKALWLLLLVLLAGCEQAKQDMYNQPRYRNFDASPLWPDGASARPPVPGTQPAARGLFADSSGGRQGQAAVANDVLAERATENPYPIDLRLLQRGRDRYMIYCLPCHSPVGDGDGLVVRRGFPSPPTFHQPRLRNAPDRHLYDVISNGYGIMAPYGGRIEPPDRWAVVAFIRALQLSQNVPVDSLTPAQRAQLPPARDGGAP